MAQSKTDEIAHAIVDVLNAHEFSSPYDAIQWEFRHKPVMEKKDLDSLNLYVHPMLEGNLTFDTEKVGRCNRDPFRRTIYVSMAKKVTPCDANEVADGDEIADLKGLTEEVAELLYETGSFACKTIASIDFNPYVSEFMLTNHRTFFSVIQVDFN